MKQPSIPAAQSRNASLNPISLMTPQRYASLVSLRKTTKGARMATVAEVTPKARQGVTTIERIAEITIGTDPQLLIRRAVNLVSAGPLRDFLTSVMAERDVNRVLTVLREDGPRMQRLPIERLRAAAQSGANATMLSPRIRETLYAAILISGVRLLLGQTVKHPYSSGDVIRSVVRDALRRLDAADEVQGQFLRNCLGWGNEDDMNEESVSHLRYCVGVAIEDLAESMTLARRHPD